jgi:hypothetical protein
VAVAHNHLAADKLEEQITIAPQFSHVGSFTSFMPRSARKPQPCREPAPTGFMLWYAYFRTIQGPK